MDDLGKRGGLPCFVFLGRSDMVYGRRYGRGGLFPWPPRRVHMLRHAFQTNYCGHIYSYSLLHSSFFYPWIELCKPTSSHTAMPTPTTALAPPRRVAQPTRSWRFANHNAPHSDGTPGTSIPSDRRPPPRVASSVATRRMRGGWVRLVSTSSVWSIAGSSRRVTTRG